MALSLNQLLMITRKIKIMVSANGSGNGVARLRYDEICNAKLVVELLSKSPPGTTVTTKQRLYSL